MKTRLITILVFTLLFVLPIQSLAVDNSDYINPIKNKKVNAANNTLVLIDSDANKSIKLKLKYVDGKPVVPITNVLRKYAYKYSFNNRTKELKMTTIFNGQTVSINGKNKSITVSNKDTKNSINLDTIYVDKIEHVREMGLSTAKYSVLYLDLDTVVMLFGNSEVKVNKDKSITLDVKFEYAFHNKKLESLFVK